MPTQERLNRRLLHLAKNGNFDEMRNVIELGANVNATEADGNTALLDATSRGYNEIVHFLLKNPNIHESINAKDRLGYTALHNATSLGNTEIVHLLLKNPNIHKSINAKDWLGHTALHNATSLGNTDIVHLLLQQPNIHKSINAPGRGMETALHLAASRGHTEIVHLLLKNPNIHESINAQSDSGQTALHLAADRGFAEIVSVLLQQPNIHKSINAKDRLGETALQCTRSIEIAKLLINHGAETIGVNHTTPELITLIQNHATALTNKLTDLKALPDDIEQLNDAQKTLVTHLTAPYKAGDPTVERETLGYKCLIDYMRENKPQLLLFAEGYHGDKLFGGVQKPYTQLQKINKVFKALMCNPISNDILNNPITQAGRELRQQHNTAAAVTKIQALGRGYVAKKNFSEAKTAATKIQIAFRRHRENFVPQPPAKKKVFL